MAVMTGNSKGADARNIWDSLNRVRYGTVPEKHLDEWADAVWRDVSALVDANAAEVAQVRSDAERLKVALDASEVERAEALRRLANLQQDWSESAMASALAVGYHAIADFMAQRNEAYERIAELEHQLKVREDVIAAKDQLIDGLPAPSGEVES